VKARDYNCVLLDFVPKHERKLTQIDPARFAENFPVSERVDADLLNGFVNTPEEFHAESVALRLTPFNSPHQIGFSGRREPDDQREAGRWSLRRISAFTSAQGFADVSFSSSVARRSVRIRFVSSSISASPGAFWEAAHSFMVSYPAPASTINQMPLPARSKLT